MSDSPDRQRGVAELRELLGDRFFRWILGLRRGLERDPAGAGSGLIDQLTAPQRALYRLFVRAESVGRQSLERDLPRSVLFLLEEERLLRPGDGPGTLRSVGLYLQEMFGAVFFAGTAPEDDFYVHFGVDTVKFIDAALAQPAGGRGLVLCTGHGGDAIALANRCDTVDAVEWIPQVARIAKLNVALSGAEDRVRVACGNLYEPLGEGPWDLILANPPFSPSLEDPLLDPAAVGGADGLDLARRIWLEGIDRLAEGGVLAQFLGMLGDTRAPFVARELQGMAERRGLAFTILLQAAPQEVATIEIPTRQAEPVLRRKGQIQAGAERVGATHYHVGTVLMRKSAVPGVVVQPNLGLTAGTMRAQMAAMRQSRRLRSVPV